MQEYRLVNKIGEGTFSDVYKALSLSDNKYVAIKCMKKSFEKFDMVKNLSQVKALQSLSQHQNIVKMIKILYDQPSGKLALVFQLMEENLYEAIIKKKTNTTQKTIKQYMHKILKALAHMHRKGFFHRDIKPENILISGDEVKLADFGACRTIGTPLPLTEYIATRWYRPPQCLLTDGYYGEQMDMWGFACVLFEAYTRYPLFSGKSETDQINKIHKIIGSPSEELIQIFKPYSNHLKPQDWKFEYHKGISISRLIPNVPEQMIDFLQKALAYDPKMRLSAQEALKHPFFSPPTINLNILPRQKSSVTNLALPLKTTENTYKITRNYEQKIEQKSPNSFLPSLYQLKLQMKPGIFNQSITNKLKKTQWEKFGNNRK